MTTWLALSSTRGRFGLKSVIDDTADWCDEQELAELAGFAAMS